MVGAGGGGSARAGALVIREGGGRRRVVVCGAIDDPGGYTNGHRLRGVCVRHDSVEREVELVHEMIHGCGGLVVEGRCILVNVRSSHFSFDEVYLRFR